MKKHVLRFCSVVCLILCIICGTLAFSGVTLSDGRYLGDFLFDYVGIQLSAFIEPAIFSLIMTVACLAFFCGAIFSFFDGMFATSKVRNKVKKEKQPKVKKEKKIKVKKEKPVKVKKEKKNKKQKKVAIVEVTKMQESSNTDLEDNRLTTKYNIKF